MNAPVRQFAVHCRYLKRSLDSSSADGVLTLCTHIVRDGQACIGPFLEDLSTHCGLWELHPDRQPVASRSTSR